MKYRKTINTKKKKKKSHKRQQNAQKTTKHYKKRLMDDFDRSVKKMLFKNSFWSVLIKNDIKRMKEKKK